MAGRELAGDERTRSEVKVSEVSEVFQRFQRLIDVVVGFDEIQQPAK